MSSSSYLGHGAKYWAEKYFEQQTQTRMPDDSSAIEWRDKYLSLEKSCSLYQAKIADLRTEVADLREKAQCKSSPEIFQGQTAEYWYTAYKNSEIAYSKLSFEKLENRLSEDTPLRYKGSTAKEWASAYDSANAQIAILQKELLSSKSHIAAMNETCEIHGHDALYWYGNASDGQAALNLEKRQKKQIILLSIFLLIGIFFSGLLLGEGYFVPHFTPSSPYITEVQQAAESTGYNSGYSTGYDSGQRAGLWKGFYGGYGVGKRNGYNRGYSAGLRNTPDEDLRWTEEDFQALREFLSNESK